MTQAMVADEYPVAKIHGKLDEAERKETNKPFQVVRHEFLLLPICMPEELMCNKLYRHQFRCSKK